MGGSDKIAIAAVISLGQDEESAAICSRRTAYEVADRVAGTRQYQIIQMMCEEEVNCQSLLQGFVPSSTQWGHARRM